MSIESRENDRLRFLTDRDGLEGSIRFCKETIKSYKKALKAAEDGVNAYGKVYKYELLGSITVLERFNRDS